MSLDKDDRLAARSMHILSLRLRNASRDLPEQTPFARAFSKSATILFGEKAEEGRFPTGKHAMFTLGFHGFGTTND